MVRGRNSFACASGLSVPCRPPRQGLPHPFARTRAALFFRFLIRNTVFSAIESSNNIGIGGIFMRWSKRRTWGLLLSGLLAANGVRAGEVEDTALTVAVRKALKRDERLAALGLGVTVENGYVTIWGPVPTGDLIAYAGGCVRQLEGVKTVTNDLHIQPAIAVQVAAPR